MDECDSGSGSGMSLYQQSSSDSGDSEAAADEDTGAYRVISAQALNRLQVRITNLSRLIRINSIFRLACE
jgi:hypothetical protein